MPSLSPLPDGPGKLPRKLDKKNMAWILQQKSLPTLRQTLSCSQTGGPYYCCSSSTAMQEAETAILEDVQVAALHAISSTQTLNLKYEKQGVRLGKPDLFNMGS